MVCIYGVMLRLPHRHTQADVVGEHHGTLQYVCVYVRWCIVCCLHLPTCKLTHTHTHTQARTQAQKHTPAGRRCGRASRRSRGKRQPDRASRPHQMRACDACKTVHLLIKLLVLLQSPPLGRACNDAIPCSPFSSPAIFLLLVMTKNPPHP